MQRWKMVTFGRYFVQLIVWVGITSSLSFDTNVVPNVEQKLFVRRKLEYGGLLCLLLCYLLYRRDLVSIKHYIIVVIIQIIIFKQDI